MKTVTCARNASDASSTSSGKHHSAGMRNSDVTSSETALSIENSRPKPSVPRKPVHLQARLSNAETPNSDDVVGVYQPPDGRAKSMTSHVSKDGVHAEPVRVTGRACCASDPTQSKASPHASRHQTDGDSSVGASSMGRKPNDTWKSDMDMVTSESDAKAFPDEPVYGHGLYVNVGCGGEAAIKGPDYIVMHDVTDRDGICSEAFDHCRSSGRLIPITGK